MKSRKGVDKNMFIFDGFLPTDLPFLSDTKIIERRRGRVERRRGREREASWLSG